MDMDLLTTVRNIIFPEESGSTDLPPATTAAPEPTLEDGLEDSEQCRRFAFSISSILIGVFVVAGLAGNALSLLVLRQLRSSSSERNTTLLLSLLAVYDIFFLGSLGVMTVVPTACSFFSACPRFFKIYPYLLVWLWPVVSLFHVQSTWATVLVAFQRFVAICIPHRMRVLCSTRKTRIYAAATFVVVNIFELPVFLDGYLVKRWDAERNVTVLARVYTSLGKSHAYQTTYKTTLSYIFLYFAPLLLLSIFTGFLVRSLRRSSRMRQKAMANHGRIPEYDSVTLMLVMTVVIYFITQPWEPIRRILELVHGGPPDCGLHEAYFYTTHVANMLGTINSACNFYVFCLFNRRVRKLASGVMCGCLMTPNSEGMTNSSNTGITINSSLPLDDIAESPIDQA